MTQTNVQDKDESENPSESSQKSSGSGSASISLTSEKETTPVTISATIDLARLLVLAQRINSRYEEEYDLSFSAMLLAFLAGSDRLSHWFKTFVRDSGAYIEELLKRRNLTSAELDRISNEPVDEDELSATKRQTSSAHDLFNVAREFNQNLSSNGLLDVRHLMAAYIYRPLGHNSDLVSLNFNRVAWSNSFLNHISQQYPKELEQWKKLHTDVFNNPPLLDSEGPSPHIVSDMWTIEDRLGYQAYAYALAQFIMHPNTKPPLTISIQAPWGGGKTSLMRMIQKELDQNAPDRINKEATKPRGELRIKDVLKTIKESTKNKDKKSAKNEGKELALPLLLHDPKQQILTVWFNAWKYESNNQVWAGLVTAIIEQVAARYDSLYDRELFYLLLNLKRLNADNIRQKIQGLIFYTWWSKVRGWSVTLVVALATAISGLAAGNGLWQSLGWVGIVLSALAGGVVAVKKDLEVKNEPATISMNELLDVPEYDKEVGFVHHVEADLKRVLEIIPGDSNNPNERRNILIFIDDLDRCYPDKVAQVMSAVNLFLAGDFANCYFVLGMDTEMVAAALQAAHKDMISFLPSDAGIPIGWRFMDKFVQLPVLLPPPEKADLERYTASLFASEGATVLPPEFENLAREAAERISDRRRLSEVVAQIRQNRNLSETIAARLEEQAAAFYDQRILDEGIATFNDNNPEIRKRVEAATTYLTGNPRDLKRFINCFRFHFFLWWWRKSNGLEIPTLDQLVRWLVLCLRWPEVVRWLRRSEGNDWLITSGSTMPSLVNRLKTLEELSANCADLPAWKVQAHRVLRLTPDKAAWLEDDDLLQFFSQEARFSENDRLSNGLGRGLW